MSARRLNTVPLNTEEVLAASERFVQERIKKVPEPLFIFETMQVSRAYIARMMGVQQSTIHAWYNGSPIPAMQYSRLIAVLELCTKTWERAAVEIFELRFDEEADIAWKLINHAKTLVQNARENPLLKEEVDRAVQLFRTEFAKNPEYRKRKAKLDRDLELAARQYKKSH
jgi:DNA-binding transcriptional regulator YiaG